MVGSGAGGDGSSMRSMRTVSMGTNWFQGAVVDTCLVLRSLRENSKRTEPPPLTIRSNLLKKGQF